MTRAIGILALAGLAAAAGCEKNELYCDPSTPCPQGMECDYDGTRPESGFHGRTCVPVRDAATGDAAGAPDACVASGELCDGIDNDCDSQVDEDWSSELGQSCAAGVGACERAGTIICAASQLSTVCDAIPGMPAAAEICSNSVDDNCDGSVDEGCDCDPGDSQACGTDVGACELGMQFCTMAGMWSDCAGGITPAAETCDDVDNDCDGSVDNGLVAACGTDVGDCVAGTQTCSGGAWGPCGGTYVGPITEDCNGGDEDCDGMTDEGCSCTDGMMLPCGTDEGACVAGSQTCTGGTWGPCAGDVGPSTETCNGIDDDCDGMIDEGFGLGAACDGLDSDLCAEGTLICDASGATTTCTDATGDATEICANSLDDDCDTMVDEGCIPPIVNGQNADLVIGQMTFTTSTANAGGESARSLDTPNGVASDGTRLWILDADNARILQWSSLPIVNYAAASIVLGQVAPTSHAPGTSQTLMQVSAGRVFTVAGYVLAADSGNHRVLIWNGVPTGNGEAADLVLGQPNFTSSAAGKAANQMKWPRGIWSDGTRLVVVDGGYHRALIWTTFPTANGEAADIVLGWPSFGMGDGDTVANPPTASSMYGPSDAFFDGSRLYVADTTNHRVMIWASFPTTNNQPADVFVGQPGPSSNLPHAGGAGMNEVGLRAPRSVLVTHNSLLISDGLNHRVVVHTPPPTTNGEAADAVLGQDDLVTDSYAFGSPAANRLSNPIGMAVVVNKLFVADGDWNRVLRFNLAP